MRGRTRATGVALALGLVAAACGGGGGDGDSTAAADEQATVETTPAEIPESLSDPAEGDSPAGASTDTAPPAAAVESDLPNVVVTDVGSGGQFNVADLAPNDRPVLLWFWAPH